MSKEFMTLDIHGLMERMPVGLELYKTDTGYLVMMPELGKEARFKSESLNTALIDFYSFWERVKPEYEKRMERYK